MIIIKCIFNIIISISGIFGLISSFKDVKNYIIARGEKETVKLNLKNIFCLAILIILAIVCNMIEIDDDSAEKNNSNFENTVLNVSNENFTEKETNVFNLTNTILEGNIVNTVEEEQEKYIYESDFIEKNNTFIDDYTGVIIGVDSIYDSFASVQITRPYDKNSYSKSIRVGDSIEFEYKNRKFQLIFYALDYEAQKYKIMIKEK